MIHGKQLIIYPSILFNDIESKNGVQNNEALRLVLETKEGKNRPRQKLSRNLLGTSENSGPRPTRRGKRWLRIEIRKTVVTMDFKLGRRKCVYSIRTIEPGTKSAQSLVRTLQRSEPRTTSSTTGETKLWQRLARTLQKNRPHLAKIINSTGKYIMA